MLWALSHLFYPWGILVQIFALVHAIRRRPEWYWYWIIFMGGLLGAVAYIIVEAVPDIGLAQDFFKGFGRRSRIDQLQATIIDNPSAGNYEELADLQWEQKRYAEARDSYDKAIAARADSVDAFYRRALCSLELKDYPRALRDLELVVNHYPRYDHDRAPGLLAHVYGLTGHPEKAGPLFAQTVQASNLPETHYNYACFLKSQGKALEARAEAEWLLNRKRTLPRHLKRLERPWFRKAQAVMKELPQT